MRRDRGAAIWEPPLAEERSTADKQELVSAGEAVRDVLPITPLPLRAERYRPTPRVVKPPHRILPRGHLPALSRSSPLHGACAWKHVLSARHCIGGMKALPLRCFIRSGSKEEIDDRPPA